MLREPTEDETAYIDGTLDDILHQLMKDCGMSRREAKEWIIEAADLTL